jgi:ABC-type sulfate transport system substrate-binding protein
MQKPSGTLLSKYLRQPFNWILILIILIIATFIVWRTFLTNSSQPLRLIVYAFSTQEEVLTQGIFPAFKQDWEAKTGQEVEIEGIFGPSGTLSIQITLGSPADIAIFSNQRHIDWLKYSKSVNRNTEQVMIASTPLVIITRPGNPANISDFSDLTRPGFSLVHADPRSSGAGEWSVLAEYGSEYFDTGNSDIAETQLKDIWQNVRLLGASARAALTLFELGAGDALVTYEQDAFLAQNRAVPLEIVTPRRTILAKHYAVIVDDNISRAERPLVEAFMAFLLSDEGQSIMSQYFLRPATIESDVLPALDQPFTVEDLGGWSQAYNNLIEDYWKTEIEPILELEPDASFLVGGN